jgi:hypothetical protein
MMMEVHRFLHTKILITHISLFFIAAVSFNCEAIAAPHATSHAFNALEGEPLF